MHPRNPYQTPPDFKDLALKFPEFRKHAKQTLTGKIEIDFKDAAAVRALTTALLKKDFDLVVELPADRLVPTLPLRLNYILWIEDLLELVDLKPTLVHGIDIGTGACSIYPILGAKKNQWHFTATESDETNYECSLKTVEQNCLKDCITLTRVNPETLLLGNMDLNTQYDFTMCNPPFFDSENNNGPKSRNSNRTEPTCPKSGGSNAASEIAVKGGEVQFIQKLLQESKEIKSAVRIYTTMLGHKSSLEPIKNIIINDIGAASWTQTEFCQGRTRRWAIAWTFDQTISLSSAPKPKNFKSATQPRPPLTYTVANERWSGKGEYSVAVVMAKIVEHLNQLKMEIRKVSESKTRSAVEFIARQNTWSKQRQKRREEMRQSTSVSQGDQPEPKKRKVESESSDGATKSEKQQNDFNSLKALVLVEESSSTISLQVQWIEGGEGRESTNQVLQYLKNHLFDK